MNYEDECKDALATVRAYSNKHAPYMSSIIYGLVPFFSPGFGTLAVTDKMVLIIDPEWFVTMPVDFEQGATPRQSKLNEAYSRLRMQAGCIMHECHHIVRGMERINRMPDKKLANIAFDLPINHDLSKATHEDPNTKEQVRTWDLPTWACYPKKFKLPEGLTGEQYYELLQKQEVKLPKTPKIASGSCGGCGGHTDPKQEQAEAEANEAVGRTDADTERIRGNALNDIKKESESGGPPGTLPDSLKALLDNDKKERLVPWRSKLGRVCRRATGRMKAGRQDYSMSRPSKRSMFGNIIRPGLVDRVLTILFIEDSSGSMFADGASPLKHVRTEIASVMQQLGIEQAWFMDADADVASPPKLIRMRDITSLPVSGGGGTDFGPALYRAEKLKPVPDIVMYLTDGAGYAPKYKPSKLKEVVWCIVPSPHGTKPCNWGHLIVCTDEAELREPYEME